MVEWTWSGWACPQTEHPFRLLSTGKAPGGSDPGVQLLPHLDPGISHGLDPSTLRTDQLESLQWSEHLLTPEFIIDVTGRWSSWERVRERVWKGTLGYIRRVYKTQVKILMSQRHPRKIIHFERRGFCGSKLYFPVRPLFHRRKHSKLILWPLIPKFVPWNNSGANNNSGTANL